MPTAVVCDDDRVVRGAITSVCEEVGLDVVAETDSGGAALELIRRFEVDVLVLDQSLPDMTGERVLEMLGDELDAPVVVVCSAYATDAPHMISLGARDVVDKADFDRLTAVLREVTDSMRRAADRSGTDRRSGERRVDPVPDVALSQSGIAAAEDLLTTAMHTVPGDSVLVMAPVGSAEESLLPALVRATVRVQDIIHCSSDLDGLVVVLRGGGEDAASAAWQRLIAAAAEAGLADGLRGAWRRIDPLGMMAAIAGAEADLSASLDGDAGLQPA